VSFSLRDYDAERYGPFLGVSDEGSAAAAIADAARATPKARALGEPDPLKVGVAHDVERLGSLGEVPVGPAEYEKIRARSRGRVLLTTNVGSHVATWHYRQPLSFDVAPSDSVQDVVSWARENGAAARERDPRPWLRLRFDPAIQLDARVEVVRAAAVVPIAVAVRAEQGVAAAHEAIELAAEGRAEAVVVDGVAQPPTDARSASPGLLNYYEAAEARDLLAAAHARGVVIEPALKIDTDSVANQIWSGLFAAREMGLHLGKYGLFPLTLQEAAQVVKRVQGWMADWTTAPAIYLDVPAIDGAHVYELAEAATAGRRWLELAAEAGASVVLIDTVEKFRGLHLVKSGPADRNGILSWDEVDALQEIAVALGVKVLWAGGISLSQIGDFGQRRPFGIYITSAVSRTAELEPGEEDIGLNSVKEPVREKIVLAKLLLETGFFADKTFYADAEAAEQEDAAATERLVTALTIRWRQWLGKANDAS
jgi:hypothetical protein